MKKTPTILQYTQFNTQGHNNFIIMYPFTMHVDFQNFTPVFKRLEQLAIKTSVPVLS